MKAVELQADNPSVKLIEPDLERDAELGVLWLHGDIGRSTLMLMGVADKDNKPTTLPEEKQRVTDFIEKRNQLNWMIEFNGKVVGSVWVDLELKDSVPSPAIHIMIGDPNVRGKGVGFSASSKVIEYLKEQGTKSLYSRHLTNNTNARNLLVALGFEDTSDPYTDKDGLEWQNVKKQL
jgi:RimJ/RimL family protein N-acetyltransferase